MKTLIGNTPLIEINGVFVKCEHMNPTGSIKDRAALEILLNCEHDSIVDVSSGNMGVSLAYISQMLGKKCAIYCPYTTSSMKVNLMKQFGATVIGCEDLATGLNLAKKHEYYFTNQFDNTYNVTAQDKMAKEIDDAMSPRTVITGIGTGGTYSALYKRFSNVAIFTPVAPMKIEGVSDGVTLPLMKGIPICQYAITKEELLSAKSLLLKEGLYVGWSSAANYAVALAGNFKSSVVILHDAGWRY